MTKNPSKNSNNKKWSEKWTQMRSKHSHIAVLDSYRKEIGLPTLGLSEAAVHAVHELRKIKNN